jgi:lactoylglutathione lyase
VEDQQKALEFCTETLGFEVRRNIEMGPQAKWIEVSPQGAEASLVLYPEELMVNWAELRPSIVFHCSDVEAERLWLESARVRITMQPTQMAWGSSLSSLTLMTTNLGLLPSQ